jgi:hypothetical protein
MSETVSVSITSSEYTLVYEAGDSSIALENPNSDKVLVILANSLPSANADNFVRLTPNECRVFPGLEIGNKIYVKLDRNNGSPVVGKMVYYPHPQVTLGDVTANVGAGLATETTADLSLTELEAANTSLASIDGKVLTDAQLRAAPVPVSGPVTDAQLRATALPVSGPVTDAQLRAAPVPTIPGRNSPVNRSGTVASAATSTQIMASNATRNGFFIQNLSASADLWFNDLGTASASQPSILLRPGDSFTSAPGYCPTGAISTFTNSAGHPFAAREW